VPDVLRVKGEQGHVLEVLQVVDAYPREELELRGEKPVEQKKAVASTTMAAEVSKPSTNAPEEKKDNPLQDDKSKCWNCKKKMGIYGYQCKCGFWFCKMHRIPEDHECTYDFATAGKKQLEKNNPLLVGKKLGEL